MPFVCLHNFLDEYIFDLEELLLIRALHGVHEGPVQDVAGRGHVAVGVVLSDEVELLAAVVMLRFLVLRWIFIAVVLVVCTPFLKGLSLGARSLFLLACESFTGTLY